MILYYVAPPSSLLLLHYITIIDSLVLFYKPFLNVLYLKYHQYINAICYPLTLTISYIIHDTNPLYYSYTTIFSLLLLVLYMEGSESSEHRILRAVKNRFGSASEVGVFSMTDRGMLDVDNPSALFLSPHSDDPIKAQQGREGAAVAVLMEGSRYVLFIIQIIVDIFLFKLYIIIHIVELIYVLYYILKFSGLY